MERLEENLLPSPKGGRWRFTNPARGMRCPNPIRDPIDKDIHYLIFPGSIHAEQSKSRDGLKTYLVSTPI